MDQPNKWTVELPFADVQQMQQDVAAARKETMEVKAQLAEAQLQLAGAGGGDSEMPRRLIAGIRAALKIVQWSQGNYDPETVRGWPHEALREFVDVVRTMPSVNINETEWATDALNYVSMAAAVERARKRGRQHELNQIPRSAIGSEAYAGQVDQILQQPPKDESEPPAGPAGGEAPPEQPPPAAA